MDFTIVLISLLTLYGSDEFEMLRALRTLRALRPLRVIARAPNLKRVVATIFVAIPSAGNVALVCCLFFLIFGIVGVGIFKGAFGYCEFPSAEVQTMVDAEYGLYKANFKKLLSREACEALVDTDGNSGAWTVHSYNFDNVGNAMSMLFQMSTTEGWVDMMYAGVDATGVDTHPVEGWSPGYCYFFVAFIIVGSFFAVNLFVGSVIEAYEECRPSAADEGKGIGGLMMSDAQREWVETQKLVFQIKLEPKLRPPRGCLRGLRQACFNLVNKPQFGVLVLVLIALNTLTMAMTSYQQSKLVADCIQYAGYAFVSAFALEAVLKLVGLGVAQYWRSNWNRFDFIVLLASGTAIAIEIFSPGSNSDIGAATSLARAARMFQIFRMAKAFSGMQKLFETTIKNLPQLVNISAVLALVMFVYAVMGVELFARVQAPQDELGHRANFQSFAGAFMLLFRACTGEAWNNVMYELMVSGSGSGSGSGSVGAALDPTADGFECIPDPTYAQLVQAREVTGMRWAAVGCSPGTVQTMMYFVSFVVIATFVMLNLFVAVILAKDDDAVLALDKEEVMRLTRVWQDFDEEATYTIPLSKLGHLLHDLAPDFSIEPSRGRGATHPVYMRIAAQIHELHPIAVDEKGRISYMHVAKGLAQYHLTMQKALYSPADGPDSNTGSASTGGTEKDHKQRRMGEIAFSRRKSVSCSQFGLGIDAARAAEVSTALAAVPQLEGLLANARAQVAADKKLGRHESDTGTMHKAELLQLEAMARMMLKAEGGGLKQSKAGDVVGGVASSTIDTWAEREAGLLLLRKWRSKHPEYGPVPA
jgi:hypothetical protein